MNVRYDFDFFDINYFIHLDFPIQKSYFKKGQFQETKVFKFNLYF